MNIAKAIMQMIANTSQSQTSFHALLRLTAGVSQSQLSLERGGNHAAAKHI